VNKTSKILGSVAGLGLMLGLGPVLTSSSGAAAQPASVTVVHGIPSVGNVDICVGGSTALLADVPFKGVATVEVPEGTYDITVKVANAAPCTGATAISAPGTAIPAGANVSVVANIAGGTPNLAIYANDVTPVAAGSGRVAVYHAANAPAVDILVNGGPGISDLTQKTVQAADLPTAAYDFTVTPAGTPGTIVLDLPDVTVPAGKLLQVYAVGAVPDNSQANPFQVITHVVDLETKAAPTTTAPPAPPAPATMGNPAMTG
jgi:hypothetical protein